MSGERIGKKSNSFFFAIWAKILNATLWIGCWKNETAKETFQCWLKRIFPNMEMSRSFPPVMLCHGFPIFCKFAINVAKPLRSYWKIFLSMLRMVLMALIHCSPLLLSLLITSESIARFEGLLKACVTIWWSQKYSLTLFFFVSCRL